MTARSQFYSGPFVELLIDLTERLASGEELELCWDIGGHWVWWDEKGFRLGIGTPIAPSKVKSLLAANQGVFKRIV